MKIPALLKNPVVVQWLVIGGIGLYAYYRFKKYTTVPTAADTAKTEALTVAASGQRPTFGDTVYVGLADKIVSAGTTWFGTNESSIYAVFSQLNNDLDMLKLVQAFGNRRAEFSAAWVSLPAWLDSELNSKEIAKLNDILKSKGIRYRF
jgi:hypothetical protein